MNHDLDERLADAQIAWFSSVRPNGSPHTVPVWFVHDEDNIWVAGSPTSRRARNVRANDQVSIAIDGSTPYSLVAEARAKIIDDPSQYPHAVTSYALKYSGFDITDESVAGPLVLMRLVVTRWLLDGSVQ